MSTVEIFTDGGVNCKTDKLGGWAYVATLGDEILFEMYGKVEDTTNGLMEVLALKEALLVACSEKMQGYSKIVIKSDSMYCVNSYNDWAKNWSLNRWRKSNNKPVEHMEHWKVIHELRADHISVEWVKSHVGNKFNEYADSLTHIARRLKD